MDQYYIWNIGSVWHKYWPETVCRSATCISWFKDFTLCLDYLRDKYHSLNTGSMRYKDVPYYIYVGQWPICYDPVILSLSWRLFDGWMLYRGYWFSVTLMLTWNCICRWVTYSSWSIEFALYLEDYLMHKYHSLLAYCFCVMQRFTS